MKLQVTLLALLLGVALLAQDCLAGGFGRRAARHHHGGGSNIGLAAQQNPGLLNWHRGYYHTAYGAPLALVVPPTAATHTEFGWGVGTTRVSPIYPQFTRPFPGPYWGGQGFLPTPLWPSDTEQFGVYYVRGPW